ncbi:acyltransferase family protein [Microbulbifer sp. ANSA003]|uniref:acyltransferase family protein n=1 Tax=Microbulbifer sp. ANSA003 TaxID=3243360 RepID=UPI0040430E25
MVRLFPALFSTIAATVILSGFLLPGELLTSLLESAVASVFSLANIFFYFDSGYFSGDSYDKPLLHLWSLGVEEQFYLIFPLLAFFLVFIRRFWAILLLLAMIAGGAWCSQYFIGRDPDAAFYLMPLRMFQFLLGALGNL